MSQSQLMWILLNHYKDQEELLFIHHPELKVTAQAEPLTESVLIDQDETLQDILAHTKGSPDEIREKLSMLDADLDIIERVD